MGVVDTEVSHEHEHHQHETTLWPPFLALSSILLGLGIVFVDGNKNIENNTNAIIGITFVLIYTIILAVFFYKEAINKKVMPKFHTEVFSKNLWMWVFLASEIIFFGVLIGVMLILRFVTMIKGNIWMDEKTLEIISGDLSIYPTIFITFVLLMSSVSMMKSVEAVERSDTSSLRNWLFVTFLGGVIFLVVKVFEYNNLMSQDGVFISTSQFWTTFYLTTGFHTLHVTLGVLILLFFVIKATIVKGETGFKAENGTPVEVLGIYWHFVDVVWIFLMPLIYLLV